MVEVIMIQQTILLDIWANRNYQTYYRYTLGMTFNTLDSWEWEHQPYFRHMKTYQDCVVLGVL